MVYPPKLIMIGPYSPLNLTSPSRDKRFATGNRLGNVVTTTFFGTESDVIL